MRLNTCEWGSGDRVAVLIHGIMASSRCWWRVGPALAERGYRVVAVDLPGHGGSPRGADPADYSPRRWRPRSWSRCPPRRSWRSATRWAV
nr:hypothetical protein GCM10020093_089220 [Planobispora longispora]